MLISGKNHRTLESRSATLLRIIKDFQNKQDSPLSVRLLPFPLPCFSSSATGPPLGGRLLLASQPEELVRASLGKKATCLFPSQTSSRSLLKLGKRKSCSALLWLRLTLPMWGRSYVQRSNGSRSLGTGASRPQSTFVAGGGKSKQTSGEVDWASGASSLWG